MIRALSSILALALAGPSIGLSIEAPAVSPCPSVFMYEPTSTEPGKWYGVVNLTTDTTLYALWLNIVLESKADILGNWVGEVTTEDNMDFKIENTKMKIIPGEPLSIRFFIQYNSQNPLPRLQAIRFNGKEICDVDTPQDSTESKIPASPGIIFGKPITANITSTTTIKPTTTTFRSQYWTQTKVDITNRVEAGNKQESTTKFPYWTGHTKNVYEDKNNNTFTVVTQTHSESDSSNDYQQVKSENRPSNRGSTTTTLKPQDWFQVKSDTNQVVTGNRVLTTPVERPQASTVGKIQPTVPLWSQTRVENHQQLKPKDKQQSRPQITADNKLQMKLQPWSQTKVENTQQKQNQERNTKLDVKHLTISNTSTYNVSLEGQEVTKPSIWQNISSEDRQPIKTEYKPQTEKITTTHYWPKITVEDHRQNLQIKSAVPTVTAVNEPIRFETKFVIDDTSNIQQDNLESKYSDSTSFIRSESSQPIKPDDRAQSKPYKRFQSLPSNSRQDQEEPREIIPIYVRPEDKSFETRPRDDLQTKTKETTQTITENRQRIRPADWDKRTEDSQENRDDEEELDRRPIKRRGPNTEERTSSWSADRSQPYTEKTKGSVFDSADDFTGYSDGGVKALDTSILPYNQYGVTTDTSHPVKYVTPEIEDFDTNPTPKKEEDIEYYFGGLPTIYIPDHGPRKAEPTCGKVFLNEVPVHSLKGSATLEGQWPWQIALYQQQTTVDFKYICGGTLVSRRHVITAAHCVTRKGSRRVVNKNTLTVYLGKHNLRTSVDGVQVKFVSRILIYPDYNATTFSRDLAILELREPVSYSDWVQPACLWPENETHLKNIVGEKGSVVGWGFEATGVAREELSLLEMPVVSHRTCLESSPDFYRRFISDYTYCAGYRDGTIVCNGDSGGGMVFKKGNNWYLRGLASLSVARQGEYRCDPDHYVIFTDIAKFLPWIEENVEDY